MSVEPAGALAPRRAVGGRNPAIGPWLVLGAGIAGCIALALVAQRSVAIGQWAVLIACASVASVVDVEIAERVWVGPGFAFIAPAMVFLGPGGVLALSGVAEFTHWLIHRTRPYAAVANLLANAGILVVGSAALEPLRSGLRHASPAAWLLVSVFVGTYVVLAPHVIRILYTWRYRTAAIATAGTGQFWKPIAALAVMSVLAARMYEESSALGLSVLVVSAWTFVVTATLVRNARRAAQQNAELASARGMLLGEALAAEDRERRYLAQLLHDDAIQSMLAARQDLDDVDAGGRNLLQRAMVTIDETDERLRGVVAEVHPAMLEHVGLEAALSVILEEKSRGRFRWSVDVRRDADGVDDRLLFSLARELIANAARHARATSVEVSIAGASGFVELTVADNGVGFSWSSDGRMPGHIGLLSVSERARAVGGEFWVESAPGGGTIAAVRMPRDAASEPAD